MPRAAYALPGVLIPFMMSAYAVFSISIIIGGAQMAPGVPGIAFLYVRKYLV
jgi:hypothetical protein